MILKQERIFIAGHRGLVGSAILRRFQEMTCSNLLLRDRKSLDLTDQKAVSKFFNLEQPNVVILAAARVGGIAANSQYPADFFRENLAIQQNIITAAQENGVKKLLFFGSNCAYPANIAMPLAEEALLNGAPERTNRSFAIAKLAGIEYCRAVNQQFGLKYFCVMPASTFGPGDNFDPERSHVIAGLIRRIHKAKMQSKPSVVIWGSGRPIREFIFSDDLAEASIFLLSNLDQSWEEIFPTDSPPIINVGAGRGISIDDLARQVKKTVGFKGELHYDMARPDGAAEKVLDVGKMSLLSWPGPKTNLQTGLAIAYKDYIQRFGCD